MLFTYGLTLPSKAGKLYNSVLVKNNQEKVKNHD